MAEGDLVIPEGYGLATMKWAVLNRTNPISTTIGFTKGSDSVVLGDLCNQIFLNLSHTGGPCAANHMLSVFTFLGVSCIYNNAGSFIGAESDEAPIIGTETGDDPLMIGNSLIVQKKTGFIGRQYRGRMYFPYMAGVEATVDYLGNLSPTAVSFIGASFVVFAEQVSDSADVWIPNLLHHVPKAGEVPSPTPITSFVMESKVGTQRRRLR